MVFKGYLEIGGREVANSARAFGYATTADCPASWLKNPECVGITDALGDVAYDFANIDQAPWFDPDQADLSKRFLGVYPITVENLSDSTRTAEVTERSNDGGRIGGRRHTSRAVRVQAWLTAQGADAMDYGMGWLAAAVSAGACGQHNSRCGVADLSFFTDCPPGRVDVPDYTAWTPQAVSLSTNPGFEATSGTVEVRRNLCTNPGAEVNTAGWTADCPISSDDAWSASGVRSFKLTGSTTVYSAQRAGGTTVLPFGIQPGTTITVSATGRQIAAIDETGSDGRRGEVRIYVSTNGTSFASNYRSTKVPNEAGESRVSVTAAIPSNATGVLIMLGIGTGDPTAAIWWDDILIEASSALGDYFDGSSSPDSDLTPSWTGTPNASASILTGQIPKSASTAAGRVVVRSGMWASEGAFSARIIDTGGAGAVGFTVGGLSAGKTYTVVAVCHVAETNPAPAGQPYARTIWYNSASNQQSAQAPNAPGEYELRLTFTVDGSEAAVRFAGDTTDIWWDMVTIVEGVYDGPPFTGSSPDDYDQYGKAVAQYSWDGAEDASTSTRETRTRFYRPQSADEYEATVSPFRRFAHDVDATSGPFTVQEHKSSDGVHVGRLVEFTITAEDAFIYAATRQVPVLPSLPTVVQDTLYNLFPTPSMELTGGGSVVVATNYAQNPSVETNAAGWASNTVAITPAAAGARSTELAASGAASYKVSVTATNSGTNGQLLAYQDVSLASIPAGSKVSVGMWATLVRASGTAVLGNIAMRVDWLNSSSATISSTSLGTEPAAGGPLAATSLTPPAGAVTARVVAAGNVTSWSAGAVLALYADALSVTVP